MVTTLAVAAPIGAFAFSDAADSAPRTANDFAPVAVAAQMSEVALNSVPDITVPLREFTGLNVPDLRVSDLRMLGLPNSITLPPLPPGLPLPPGVTVPTEIPLPGIPEKPAPQPPNVAPEAPTPTSPPSPANVAPAPAHPAPNPSAPGHAAPAQASPTPGAQPPAAPAPGAQPPAAPALGAPAQAPLAPGAQVPPTPTPGAQAQATPAPGAATQPAPDRGAQTQGSEDGVAPETPTRPTSPVSASPGSPTDSAPPASAAAPNGGAPEKPAPAQPSATPGAANAVPANVPADATPTPTPAPSSPPPAPAPANASPTPTAASPAPSSPALPPANENAGADGRTPGAPPAASGQPTPPPSEPAGQAPGAPAASNDTANTPAPDASGKAAKSPQQHPAIPLAKAPAGSPANPVKTIPAKLIAAPGTPLDAPALSPGAIAADMVDKVGAEVKELSQDTPFSMVAVTAADLANTTIKLRAKQLDGTWSPWYASDPVDTRATDKTPAGGRVGTEPIYVGETKTVQMLTTRKPAAGPDHDPAHLTETALKAVLINPGRAAIDAALNNVAAPLPGGGPRVITRAQWGADESIRCEEPTYDDGVAGITVHHTAGRNEYSRAESAGIVRAIYRYHADTLGWCDIGYNALVDKYGQIFEGRYGGLDRDVQGAHAGGFNENTAGVALMGNYESETPSNEALNAVGNYIGWRSKIAGIDPRAHTTMISEGTEFTFYDYGEEVELPVVFAHRDVGNTDCPGDAGYAMMDRIRSIAAAGAGIYRSPATAAAAQVTNSQTSSLVAKLKEMSDNDIAKHWVTSGGVDGPLGAPRSELLKATDGRQYAKFENGLVYAGANPGETFEVVGAILKRYVDLGADTGALGLPTSASYPVPDGTRADFENGSLVLNETTGVVTTFWRN
ncbi:hypothetical protein GCM10011591_29280 [Nocardia camponoti]|uniref:Peptidoglycan recognition protein family domain-containing protein n=2 Tax=Nocardia camponoti TaxID=1616106 RepID=A0A917VAI7_9NOCA|nr:hypothetical protein GCM10011591_29280 [Nocardia camponoti]